MTTRRRLAMFAIAGLAAVSLILGGWWNYWNDREQCRAAVRAIENSRTMWEYLVEQNPGPEADAFAAEMNRRIPPAHCRGSSLIVDTGDTTPSPPITSAPGAQVLTSTP